ncbi:unnamed protein product, partial [Iphiclides podalirius]
MLVSYDVVTAFGVSALLSFVVFSGILLALAAAGGLLRARKVGKAALTKQIVTEKLLQNGTMAVPSAPEPTPVTARRLLGPQD